MTTTLAKRLVDALAEANVLDANNATFATDRVRAIVRDIQRDAHEYITYVSEADAVIRSGLSKRYFRARFPEWARRGWARFRDAKQTEREYLLLVVPAHHDSRALESDAIATARELGAA